MDSLNKYFASTASRTTGVKTTDTVEDLMNYVDELQPPATEWEPLTIRKVTPYEVLREIKALRVDTSTGSDTIPVKFLKPVAEYISSPLTNIINTCIEKSTFPTAWKEARITPIPKIDNPLHEQDLRPISILPAMSKIFEWLVHHQVIEYIDKRTLFENNISGYRKGHSTTTVLLGIRNDIAKAMKRGEITLMVLADYSKAFDTIKFKTVLEKMNSLGFSKSFLQWTVNYLTNRKHFVQIDNFQNTTKSQSNKFSLRMKLSNQFKI